MYTGYIEYDIFIDIHGIYLYISGGVRMGEERETVQMLIKLPKELRDNFKKLTMLNDTTMADEIRDFMQGYVNQYQAPKPRLRIKRKTKEVIETNED
jgi:hypothetical protein